MYTQYLERSGDVLIRLAPPNFGISEGASGFANDAAAPAAAKGGADEAGEQAIRRE